MGDSPAASSRAIDLTEDTQAERNSSKLNAIELLDTQIPNQEAKADRGKGLSLVDSLVKKYSGRSRKADRGEGLSIPPPGKDRMKQIEEASGSQGKADRRKGLSIPPPGKGRMKQIDEPSRIPLKVDRGKGLSLLKSLEAKYSGRSGKAGRAKGLSSLPARKDMRTIEEASGSSGVADRGEGLSIPGSANVVIQIEDTQNAHESTVSKSKNKFSRMKQRKDREKNRRYRLNKKARLQKKDSEQRTLFDKLVRIVTNSARGKSVYTEALVEMISRIGSAPSAAGARAPLAGIITHATGGFCVSGIFYVF